jgi:hypothetical protein
MTKEIDCCMTDRVVCPYCGYKHEDSHEYFNSSYDDNTNIECCECGKHFSASQNVTVDYSTEKLPCLNNEGDHKWSMWYEVGVANMMRRYCRDCGKNERSNKEMKE